MAINCGKELGAGHGAVVSFLLCLSCWLLARASPSVSAIFIFKDVHVSFYAVGGGELSLVWSVLPLEYLFGCFLVFLKSLLPFLTT